MSERVTGIEALIDVNVREFSLFKGKFIAVHDVVINKNLLQMKLPSLNKIVIKQDQLLNGDDEFPAIQTEVAQALDEFETVKQEFTEFITGLREMLQGDILQLVEEWVAKYESIMASIEEMRKKL